jgi:aspartate aminotransferase
MSRAARLRDVQIKATTRLADQVRHLRERGVEPINLATARPDFDTPWAIKEATREAIAEPHTYVVYSESRGLIELREAIAAKLRYENGIEVDPGEQLLITAGTHEALSVALQALLDPGDEVVLVDPSWVAYQGMVRLAGGVPTFTTLRAGRLDEDDLRAAITPRTKAILVNNPNNPTGTVLTRQELEGLARVAQEHDLLVITDEIYEHFLYDGRQHVSLATLPGMAERTLTINGVSKAYAMTGWRVGYAAGPSWWIEAMLLVHQHFISAPCTFAQKGAVAAFTVAKDAYAEMVAAYTRRRAALAAGLTSLGLQVTPPEGACFYFPRFPGGLSSQELSDLFLERAGLMLTPGSAFGPSGEGHLRLSFASLPESQVPEVVRRMENVMDELAASRMEGKGKERA